MNHVPGKLTYLPNDLSKFKGKTNPQCRSKWEYKFCEWCDKNANVIMWSSEPLNIPYIDKFTGRSRQYFPDFVLKIKDKYKQEVTWVVEIKPFKETQQPSISNNKSTKSLITEKQTWIKNLAKWNAAEKYCRMRGWKFKILTERELF